MGLFSKLFKNKQDSTGADSGQYTRAEDRAATDRARSKRASSAEGASRGRAGKDASDPVLPEKKRARRRLVGAIALALAVAVGLPMVLDSEPKPLASDIEIKIPPKDKPAEAVRAAAGVSASAALDASEEIVAAPAAPAAPLMLKPAQEMVTSLTLPPLKSAEAKGEAKAAAKPEPKTERKAEAKPELKADGKGEHKAEAKPEPKAEHKPELKSEPKPDPKTEHKPEPKAEHKPEAKPAARDDGTKPVQSAEDAARALAILEGKGAIKPAESNQRFAVRVAALASQDKVDQLQDKLREAGIKSYTQKVPTPNGELTRISVGPFGSKDEAEKVRAKLVKLGLGGALVPL